MCEKCIEINAKIEHYKWLAGQLTDIRTIQGIDELIDHMKARMAELHPQQTKEKPPQ